MEKLKFTVTYSKTVNLGNYNSHKLSLSQEYYVGETKAKDAFNDLHDLVGAQLSDWRNGDRIT